MYIKYLKLINFRNYKELNLKINKNINIFIGDNAQGKTNILESIYYCSIGKSSRTSKDKELIRWDGQEAYIKLHVANERLDKKIEIKIFKEGRKGINVNSIKVNKVSELMGILNAVMFSPEDLKIVKESASYRRKFIDIELCKLSKKYYFTLVQYNKVLNERNTILRKWNKQHTDVLQVYDEQLALYGSYIVKARDKYVRELNFKGNRIHRDITSGLENIEFIYLTSTKDTDNPQDELLKILSNSRKRDLDRGMTSLGPHRDDFEIRINGIDARSFGSQGQQRTSVLTIKFASLEIIKDTTGEYPILLLDDVLSELDASRQKYILTAINNIQTFITCTGIGDIKSYIKNSASVFTVKNGTVNIV
ncbi:DNA replication/repair protein RecF [Clostridium sp. DJ247]|uniref:DNA replication/repair protein RecF n=1 Tax=Clostridium sp. DJ247 TaxID=2726188 RepID=UPI001627366F|nr:DNA replication/repair protein RecF [Clostridium sp. DJ247]MBC2582657.1 DNA replication/repair protein RecF [Clostridium sp. DJ247]